MAWNLPCRNMVLDATCGICQGVGLAPKGWLSLADIPAMDSVLSGRRGTSGVRSRVIMVWGAGWSMADVRRMPRSLALGGI